MSASTREELALLIRSGWRAIAFESFEEDRALGLIERVAQGLERACVTWSLATGLAEDGEGNGRAEGTCAVAAPHIDLRVSEKTYSLAYGALRGPAPPAVLILGTGHSQEQPFCLTGKTFATPLGEVSCDEAAVERLRDAGGTALSADDFHHRSEHSIEFQLIFLQRLFE